MTPRIIYSQGLGIEINPPISILHAFDNSGATGTTAGLTIEAAGGDAVAQFLAGQRWVMGIDNSDAQKFKIASSTDLNTDARLTIQTTGEISIGRTTGATNTPLNIQAFTGQVAWLRLFNEAGVGEWNINENNGGMNVAETGVANARLMLEAGGNVGFSILNPVSHLHSFENNTTGTDVNGLTIEQSGTGDAISQYLITGGQRWVTGLDNSDGDRFKIASSTDLNTNARMTIETGGHVGIGITDPSDPLHVFSSTADEGITIQTGNNLNAQGLAFQNSGGFLYLVSP